MDDVVTGCPVSGTCAENGRSCALASAWPGARRRIVEVARGGRFTVGGTEPQCIRTVHSGLMGLCVALADGRRQILCLAAPGEALCSCDVPGLSCWLEALAPTTLCEAMLPDADDHADGSREALLALLGLGRQRLEATLAHVVTLGRLDGRERLASFLADMARRTGRLEDEQWTVSIPMTREDIADYLGLNADTVTRILGRLKREKHVTAVSAHEFRLRSLEAIEALLPVTQQDTAHACGH